MADHIILTSKTHSSINLRMSKPKASKPARSVRQAQLPIPPTNRHRDSTISNSSTLSSTSSTTLTSNPAESKLPRQSSLTWTDTFPPSTTQLSPTHTTPAPYHSPFPESMIRGDSYQQHKDNEVLNRGLARSCREVRPEREEKGDGLGLKGKGMRWACGLLRV